MAYINELQTKKEPNVEESKKLKQTTGNEPLFYDQDYYIVPTKLPNVIQETTRATCGRLKDTSNSELPFDFLEEADEELKLVPLKPWYTVPTKYKYVGKLQQRRMPQDAEDSMSNTDPNSVVLPVKERILAGYGKTTCYIEEPIVQVPCKSDKEGEHGIAPQAMLYLFMADRINQQVQVKKWLAAGDLVISDRNFVSTLVYQQDEHMLERLKTLVLEDPNLLVPDLLLWLDVTPTVAVQRITTRGGETNAYDKLAAIKKNVKRYAEILDSLRSSAFNLNAKVLSGDVTLASVIDSCRILFGEAYKRKYDAALDKLQEKKSPGFYVVIEGVDGAGTTSVSKGLVTILQSRGLTCHWICEPSLSPLGSVIRASLNS